VQKIITGTARFEPLKIFRILINRINHRLAHENLRRFPQLAIFSFDHIGLRINLDGRYEGGSLDLIGHFIQAYIKNSHQSIAIDVGANIGNHSLFFSEFFHKVISFEPNPRTFELLKFNAKYSAPKANILPICVGLGSEQGRPIFLSSKSNVGASCIVNRDHQAGHCDELISIDIAKADELDIPKKNIALVKLDVEGHEIFALEGMSGIIAENRPVILFEQSEKEIHDQSSLVIEHLRDLGYQFGVIRDRIYFGENPILKILSFGIRTVVGHQLQLVEATTFKRRRYDMIVAIPNEKWMR